MRDIKSGGGERHPTFCRVRHEEEEERELRKLCPSRELHDSWSRCFPNALLYTTHIAMRFRKFHKNDSRNKGLFDRASSGLDGAARHHPNRTHDLRSGSHEHHISKNSVQKTVRCNLTSNPLDDGRMYRNMSS